MKILDSDLLTDLSQQARTSPRLRHHLNLHGDPGQLCQRLLIAIEPGSYVHPHRHQREPKPECLIALRGKMALFLFDDDGNIMQIQIFGPGTSVLGADIPAGVWHTVVSLEAGSVFFETKAGPYRPASSKEPAPWAPEEGTPGVPSYLQRLEDGISEKP